MSNKQSVIMIPKGYFWWCPNCKEFRDEKYTKLVVNCEKCEESFDPDYPDLTGM